MVLELLIIKYFLTLVIFILSTLVSIAGKYGLLGVSLQKILNYRTKVELIVVIVMVSGILMVCANILYLIINYFLSINNLNSYASCIIDSNSNAQDPVRFWPSGTAQTWGIIGSAAALYRATPGSVRVKTTAALVSLGITIPLNVYIHAVENPNGFNRLMYSWVHYKQTGNWPAVVPTNVSDSILDTALHQNSVEAESKIIAVQNASKLLPDSYNQLLSHLSPENLFLNFIGLFKPAGVEGHLDDLIGQQLFIHFLLIIVVISLIILFTLYFSIQTMYNNKEFITKKFNNRFIRLYLKYQIFLAKISLIILPLLIMLGLIELIVGLHFLITHPIPFEELPIDLHTYLKKR